MKKETNLSAQSSTQKHNFFENNREIINSILIKLKNAQT